MTTTTETTSRTILSVRTVGGRGSCNDRHTRYGAGRYVARTRQDGVQTWRLASGAGCLCGGWHYTERAAERCAERQCPNDCAFGYVRHGSPVRD